MSATTKMSDVATAAKTAIDAAAISSLGNTLKVYSYQPRDMDTLPAVAVDGPSRFTRVVPDEHESQLGTTDWHLVYTLRIYVELDDPATTMDEARKILGQVIAAIDADPNLGGNAEIGAVITTGQLGYTDAQEPRQMAVYECELEVWALV